MGRTLDRSYNAFTRGEIDATYVEISQESNLMTAQLNLLNRQHQTDQIQHVFPQRAVLNF
jgi:hypothetical protein